MAYTTGNTIAANDYNTYLTGIQQLYGVGSGQYGYGQTAIAQTNVLPNSNPAPSKITAQQWTKLHDMFASVGTHQGADISLLLGAPSVGDKVSANQPYPGLLGTLQTGKFNVNPSYTTLTTSAYSLIRASVWTTQIIGTVDADWLSEDAARYFFNTGGEIRLRFTHPNGTAGRDDEWRGAFANFGTLSFKAKSAVFLASSPPLASSLSSHGFYDMTDVYTPIVTAADADSASYSTDIQAMSIQIKRKSFVGANSGNGSGIRINITLSYSSISTPGNVATGMGAYFDVKYTSSGLTGIAAPSFSTYTAF